MCGRFVQLPLQSPKQCPWQSIANALLEITAKYNLSPTQRAAVVLDACGNVNAAKFRFGLIPPWAKDLKIGYNTINARVETVSTKPAIVGSLRSMERDRVALEKVLIPICAPVAL